MSQQQSGPQKMLVEVRTELDKMGEQFKKVLPSHVTPEKFVRIVLTAIQNTPDLLLCERRSLFNACMKCAQDGLIPDGRQAALIPFNDRSKGKLAVYMPMLQGILFKVHQAGEIATLNAQLVHEKDKFRYWVDSEGEHLEHEPDIFSKERGEVIGGYAVAKTKSGHIYYEPMPKAEIEKIRDVSRSKDNGPWKGWWSEMAKKTMIRRLFKRVPIGEDLDRIIRRDDDQYDLEQKLVEDKGSRIAAQLTQKAPEPNAADDVPADWEKETPSSGMPPQESPQP